ncbi:MAG: NAAT family transporter [Synechococcaceae cyanobacterium SM2_3_1]|nr:NAAT family transporter [Synechococcaceae cyanobacterium SM2_3_1]
MQEFATTTLAMFLALFPITNPIGAVPIFYSLTADLSHHEQNWQARQTAFYSVLVLIVFLFTGPLILSFFGISLGVLKIAGGLLVGQTAWDMLTVRQRLTDPENQEAMKSTDISLIPMAIPIVSGPGAIGIVIDLAPATWQWLQYLGCMVGILLVGLTLYFSLCSGKPIIHALGTHGIGAFNRILGFFILAISVQMISDGAFNLLQTHLTGLASFLPTDLISPLS